MRYAWRVFLSVLVVAMISVVLAGCGDPPETPETDTDPPTDTGTDTDTDTDTD